MELVPASSGLSSGEVLAANSFTAQHIFGIRVTSADRRNPLIPSLSRQLLREISLVCYNSWNSEKSYTLIATTFATTAKNNAVDHFAVCIIRQSESIWLPMGTNMADSNRR